MSGYYLMHRGWMDNPAFGKEPFCERAAWAWLIDEAAYKACRKRVGSAIVTLERGQVAASVRFLAEAWGWSKSRVDRFLKRLADEQMIGTAAGQGVNVITLCNYDKYQPSRDSGGTDDGTAAGQQRDSSGTNKKEGKEVKETSSNEDVYPPVVPPPSKRGSRIPDGALLPVAWADFAEQEGHHDPQREWQKFTDYWRAQPGQKGVKVDWEATWRNWVRRAVEDGKRNRGRAEVGNPFVHLATTGGG